MISLLLPLANLYGSPKFRGTGRYHPALRHTMGIRIRKRQSASPDVPPQHESRAAEKMIFELADSGNVLLKIKPFSL